jgi:hypothetical protein
VIRAPSPLPSLLTVSVRGRKALQMPGTRRYSCLAFTIKKKTTRSRNCVLLKHFGASGFKHFLTLKLSRPSHQQHKNETKTLKTRVLLFKNNNV